MFSLWKFFTARPSWVWWLLLGLSVLFPAQAEDSLRIGGKRFTEAYVLVELLGQVAQASGTPVSLKPGLGNTAIVLAALQAGSIDLYPEYTGTIALEILKRPGATDLASLREQLKPMGLGVDVLLGFHNGYALALRADRASALGLAKLSDLAAAPSLTLGLSNEFLGRQDGWSGLAKRYGLPHKPQGLDHGLAYEAVAQGQVDVIDVYTTDAQLDRHGLHVLQDDAQHFPRYEAVLLYRLDVPQRFPAAWAALRGLTGSIDEGAMRAMNARAEVDGVPFPTIAREHLARSTPTQPAAAASGFWAKLFGPDLMRLTLQHLALVTAAVGGAVLLGVPLATFVARRPRARTLLLGAIGMLQTVPALALLALLISLLDRIGSAPALLALTLYALLPVMQNTCVGLAELPAGLLQAAQALGLTARQRLRHIELPLALPVIVAGVRTATSLAVGTATIAAFIGAGGLGERIVTGLALNDRDLMLAGALPAAALALVLEWGFALLLRRLRRRA